MFLLEMIIIIIIIIIHVKHSFWIAWWVIINIIINNNNNNNNMYKQDEHFSYKNCYQYGSCIKINEWIDKNLIIYETGIHYTIIISKKR